MLQLNNICKTYNKGAAEEVVIFDNFNLTAEKGEFISIVGSNGSGKTSLFNIIGGNVKPDLGAVFLGGRDISKMKPHVRSQTIARVFQDPKMGTCPSMTILENMALADNKGKPFNLSKAINKNRIPDYKELLSQLELGLEDKLNIKVGALSGGQRQALALLIAMKSPELLLLDEHTAALDPKTSENIMKLTDKIVSADKVTTLMITHNLRFAISYGTRLVMMHKGSIVLDIAGEEKKKLKIGDVKDKFAEIFID